MEIKHTQRKVDDFNLAGYNPRTISKSRFEDLKRSIQADPDFLSVRPIIVNVNPERAGIIIGGHMRYLAAKELGMTELPAIEVDVDEKTEKQWNLKDNSHHGEWDDEMLAEMVVPFAMDFANALPGDVLDNLLNEYGIEQEEKTEEQQLDDIASQEATITQDGDLWQLGDHLLLCGDSTLPEAFERLLGDEPASMVWTDPPYNVNYGGSQSPIWGEARQIDNDKMSPVEWSAFVKKWMARLHENVKGATYVCMSMKEIPSVMPEFLIAGFHWSDTIIWVKNQFTPGRADYQRQHETIFVGRKLTSAPVEPILYGWPNDMEHKWNGGRDEGDAWFFKRPSKNPIHPTMKPVELVMKAVTNSSNRGDTVLDPFMGGGSALIACERSGRKCRGIELSEHYCDAIIARYVGHTKNYDLLKNGEPYHWDGAVIDLGGVHA